MRCHFITISPLVRVVANKKCCSKTAESKDSNTGSRSIAVFLL